MCDVEEVPSVSFSLGRYLRPFEPPTWVRTENMAEVRWPT